MSKSKHVQQHSPDLAGSGPGTDPYVIIFDGGSKGNPGNGYGSYLLVSPTGREVHEELDYADQYPMMTNNQAEYRTLIQALRHLRELLADRATTVNVRVEGDSQLVLNQLSGQWKIKNQGLRELHAEASTILPDFGRVEFRWHPRERSVRILGH